MKKLNNGNVTADRLQGCSRLLTRKEAAAYCRLSPQGFSTWVKNGRLPGPIAGTARLDLRAIDAALYGIRCSATLGSGYRQLPTLPHEKASPLAEASYV